LAAFALGGWATRTGSTPHVLEWRSFSYSSTFCEESEQVTVPKDFEKVGRIGANFLERLEGLEFLERLEWLEVG